MITIISQKLLKFLFADLIVTKMIEQRKEPRGLTTQFAILIFKK